jgi:hypothetical protein
MIGVFMNQRGFSIYMVLSVIGLAVLVFILVLPSFFNFEERERTAKCIENMKLIHRGMADYMQRKDKEYSGDVAKYMHVSNGEFVIDNVDVSDLKQDKLVDSKVDAYCPESKAADKYIIIAHWKKGASAAKPAANLAGKAAGSGPTEGFAKDEQGQKIPEIIVKCPLEKEHPKHVLPPDYK